MTLSSGRSHPSVAIDPQLAELAEDLANRLRAGESVDLEGYLGEHPAEAEALRRLLPTIAMMADLGRSAVRELGAAPGPGDPTPVLGSLGDYRIVREVGRGGMGVVYEAHQLSLNRRVALKVLPFAATIDPRQLQRFQNEAQAAAGLHHTHIVPVFAVGCEQGVHYYAMQFIEGRSLAEVIGQLRERMNVVGPAGKMTADATTNEPAASPETLRFQEPNAPAAEPTSRATAGLSSATSITGRPFFQTVARLVVQAAEALEYAHSLGVVHRDVKPANLLLDPRGDLWVTDFGLARLHADAGLTMTGDVLGTLRYMSPEQALAKRVVIDHRSDIYSLGATIYELLALRPAVEGRDRQEILRRIAFEEPRPLRQVNPSVPRELETIVLKAMAKEPAARYATAQELAEDLRRYLEHKPIRARRPGLLERSAMWSRRHRPVVAAGLVCVALAIVGLSVATALVATAYRREARLRVTAEAQRLLAQGQEKEIRRRVRDARHARYVAEIRLAAQQMRNGDARAGEHVLDGVRPAADEEDVRGFEWSYLEGQAHQERATLRGHAGDVHHVEFAPDGRTLASAGKDGTARIWDVATGRQLNILSGHVGEVNWVTYAPDGRTLASASDDGTIRLWDTADGRVRATRVGHGLEHPLVAALFTPDGRRLISATTYDGLLQLWDVDTGREFASWGPVAGRIEALALSRDGSLLATGGADSNLHLFDMKDPLAPRERALVENHARGTTECVAFAPDGRTLAATCGGNVDLYDIATGRLLAILRGGGLGIVSAAFSPDGRMLAFVNHFGTIQLWDLPVGSTRHVLIGHTSRIWCVAFAPDGRTIATCGHDETVKLWDTARHRNRIVLDRSLRGVSDLAIPPGGSLILAACGSGEIRALDLETGAFVASRPGAKGLVTNPIGAALTQDGRTLVTRLGHATALTDLTGARPTVTVPNEDAQPAVLISPDGGRFAQSHKDGSIGVWDTATATEELRLRPKFASHSWPFAFTPEGRLLTGHLIDGGKYKISLRLWDLATARICGEYDRPRMWVHSTTVSPDGRTLAVGCGDRILLLDASNLAEKFVLSGHTAIVVSLSFSSDGRTLASGSQDRTVRLWSLATGLELLMLDGHEGPVSALRFSPDGRVLASGGEIEVILWHAADRATGRPERPAAATVAEAKSRLGLDKPAPPQPRGGAPPEER